jgi:hypothetical protein
LVPNAYFDTRVRSLTLTVSDPVGQEVQTPPCFAQDEQVQARAGISDGSGRQSSANEIFAMAATGDQHGTSALVRATLYHIVE